MGASGAHLPDPMSEVKGLKISRPKIDMCPLGSAKAGRKADVLRNDSKIIPLSAWRSRQPAAGRRGRCQQHVQSIVIFGQIRFINSVEFSVIDAGQSDKRLNPQMQQNDASNGKIRWLRHQSRKWITEP